MAAMPPSSSVTCDVFLANLRQSQLLSDTELAVVEREARTLDRGKLLARALVDRGVLTRFQAEQLLVGKTNFILGQYVVLELIGAGGMGRVFKARHRAMSRIVALKVLSSKLVKTDRAQELFQREARAAARLLHPNIVAAYDFNHVRGRYFLVMEYVNGPNLDQLVRKEGPPSIGLACDYIRQAANGLQCAYSMGMVHRDIKPANLLLQRAGHDGQPTHGVIKLTDFGLARLNETSSLAGDDGTGTLLIRDNSVMGTPDYLSPEQARDLHQTDIRGDLYSLGCTFYYLLTGSVPFPGGTMLEKLVRHGVQEPTPVEHLRLDVPQEVAAIVQRLMAKDPEDRFQTPAELADALTPFAIGGPSAWIDGHLSEPLFPSDSALEGEDEEEPEEVASAPELAFHPSSWDESSALAGTVPPDMSATPLSAIRPSAQSKTFASVIEEEQRRLRQILMWTGGVMGGLLLLAGIMYLLLRGS
jgi:serine/threonine protein kinase